MPARSSVRIARDSAQKTDKGPETVTQNWAQKAEGAARDSMTACRAPLQDLHTGQEHVQKLPTMSTRQIRPRSPRGISKQGDICQISLAKSWAPARIKEEQVYVWRACRQLLRGLRGCGGCRGPQSAKHRIRVGSRGVTEDRQLEGSRGT